jgi:hypothetical protein
VFNASKAPAALADHLPSQHNEQEIRLACYGYFQPSLVFYCRREVCLIEQENRVLELLRGPLPAYVFMPASAWDTIQAQAPAPCRVLGRHHDLYRGWDVVVVSNR